MGTEEIPTEGQLDIVKQMNDLLAEQAKLWKSVADAMGSAMGASQGMKNATEQQNQQSQNQVDMSQQVVDGLQQQTDGANALADALGRTNESTQNNTQATSDWTNKIGKGVKTAGLLGAAMNTVGSVVDSVTGTFSLMKGVFSGVMGIFGAGLKTVTGFFSGLMGAAADYRNKAGPAMFEANQEIVDSFGNLNDTQGKFVKGLTKELIPAQNALKGASNSLYAAIGQGHDVLKAMTALAKEFGDDLVYLQDQIGGAASELLIANKGMGLTGEALKNLGSNAKASGGTLKDSLTEGMVASAHLSKQFGVDVKLIGKGLNAMAGDMKTFGHMSTKEMAAVATYSAKLGVEIKDLQGVMGAFDTFESAAQNAGKLAEAFGMNVDAMEMMNANNPAERIDMLRKSLQETGKSFDELSRHEKALMAQTAGMDMKSLQNAMSVDVDEMGFDDFGDAAEEAAEKMTPEQAMKDVAESIKKMAHSMTQMTKGPFSEFMRGFMQVLNRSPEWRGLMKQISQWLLKFFDLGKKVGDMFLGWFRTNDGMLKQFQSLFSLERIEKFTKKIEDAFGNFFELLSTDPKAAMEGLWKDIMAAITEWSSDTSDGATGIGDMLYNMIEGGIKLLHGLIPSLMESLADGLVYLTESLRDWLEKPNDATNQMRDGIGGALQAALADIGKVWTEKLWPAIKDLFTLIWEKAQPFVDKIFWWYIKGIIMRAFITAMASVVASSLVSAIAAGIAKLFGKATKDAEKDQEKAGNSKGIFEKLTDALKAMKEINLTDVAMAGVKIVVLTALFGVALVALAYAISKAIPLLTAIKVMDFIKGMFMIGIAIVWAIAIVDMADLLKPSAMVKAGLALLAGALFFAVSVGAYALAIAAVIPILSGIKFMQFVSAMAQVGIAVLATVALTAIGFLFFNAAVATGGIVLAGLGLLAGATFFGVSVAAYAGALALVIPILSGVKFMDAVKMFVLVGAAIIATVALTAAGALLALAIPAMVLATAGMWAGSKLLEGALVAFGEALSMGVDSFKGVDLKKVLTMMEAITLAILAIIGLSVVGPAFAVAGWFGLDKVIASGVGVMVNIAEKSFPKLAGVINAIQKIPMDDPKKFQQRMDAIGKLIAAVQGLANLGLEAGKMAMVAGVFSKKDPQEMMTSMENFIVNTVNSISNMVENFVVLAQGLSKEDLEKVGAVAGIIEAVSNLAAGMLGPMSDIIKNQSAYSIYKGETASKQMDTLASGVGKILSKLSWYLPKIIKSLKASVEGITNPEEFKKKAEALGALFDGIAKIADTVGKLYYGAQKAGKGFWKDTSAEKVLGQMFASIANVFNTGGNFDRMVKNAALIVSNAGFPETAKVEAFAKGMDSIMKMMDSLINLSDGFAAKNNSLTAMGNIMTNWGTSTWAPHELIGMMVDEAKLIAESMKDMNIDLKKIHLRPLLDDISLGRDGKRTFEIKPKAVNLTVNFSVVMNAEELASQIYKGNKKNKKEGFFVLTEEAKSAELEGAKK